MKNTLFNSVIFFFLGVLFLNAQNSHYYYYKGNKIPITLDKSSLNISTDESFQTQSIERLNLKKPYFKEINKDKSLKIPPMMMNI